MNKIPFQNGTMVNAGYVEIDGQRYPTVEPEYSGTTPLSAQNLNTLQDNVEDAIDNLQTLPSGGTQGQVLTKQSATEGDADWETIQTLPSGGTTGQVLTKQSSTDGDADWESIETNEVYIGDEQDAPESAKLIIDEDELANLGSEVVNSLSGNEETKAPSVKAVNNKIAEIIESGSNENGDYIKFADGTMICTVYMEVTDQAISGSYGSLYQGTRAWTFPIPFKTGTNPSVLCNQFLWGTGASFGTVASQNNTIAILRGYDAFSREAGTKTAIAATAIGKWK